jgi:hypothetical protein
MNSPFTLQNDVRRGVRALLTEYKFQSRFAAKLRRELGPDDVCYKYVSGRASAILLSVRIFGAHCGLWDFADSVTRQVKREIDLEYAK